MFGASQFVQGKAAVLCTKTQCKAVVSGATQLCAVNGSLSQWKTAKSSEN
jgi:hypothetical protein